MGSASLTTLALFHDLRRLRQRGPTTRGNGQAAVPRRSPCWLGLSPQSNLTFTIRRPASMIDDRARRTGYVQSFDKNCSKESPALKRLTVAVAGVSFSSARCFISRSASTYAWVVSMLSWPSHKAMTAMSTPACNRCSAVVCRLFLRRHSRHYVPFRTMLSAGWVG